jgi:AcrR family transcriptional regulator
MCSPAIADERLLDHHMAKKGGQTRKMRRKLSSKKPKRRKNVGRPPARKMAGMRRVRADEVLANALRLFAEVGYANATVKAIGDAANVNPALLYYYYDSKEALFIEALRFAINSAIENQDSIDLVERSADPTAVIRFYFEKNRRLVKPLSHMLKLMLEYRTAGTRIAAVDTLIARFYDAELSLLSRAIRRGIRNGQFRRVDVERTAQFVSTHLDGLVTAATIRPDVDATVIISHLEKVLFDYLGASSGAPASFQAASHRARSTALS